MKRKSISPRGPGRKEGKDQSREKYSGEALVGRISKLGTRRKKSQGENEARGNAEFEHPVREKIRGGTRDGNGRAFLISLKNGGFSG